MLRARILLAAMIAAPPLPDCDPDDPGMCAMPLPAGVAAPFPGQLLSPKLALHLARVSSECEQRTALARQQAADDANIDVQRAINIRELDRQNFDATIAECQRALGAARDELSARRHWYASPWFWAPVAAVATGLAVGAALVLPARQR